MMPLRDQLDRAITSARHHGRTIAKIRVPEDRFRETVRYSHPTDMTAAYCGVPIEWDPGLDAHIVVLLADERCNCIATINASLAKRNTRLSLADGRPMLVTERISNGRGMHPAIGMLATHCPFCGVRIGDSK